MKKKKIGTCTPSTLLKNIRVFPHEPLKKKFNELCDNLNSINGWAKTKRMRIKQ